MKYLDYQLLLKLYKLHFKILQNFKNMNIDQNYKVKKYKYLIKN